MLNFQPVEIDYDLTRENPLFVGHFFALKSMWWSKRKIRQGLIISIAVAWYHSSQKNVLAPGFVNEETLLTAITKQSKDAKVILEKFFDITRIGYNFNNGNKSPTQISPKKLSAKMVAAIINIVDDVKFNPGLQPADKQLVVSKVRVMANISASVQRKLKLEGREDLLPSVRWLLKQEGSINFYYERAGTLLARDKSVWPIKSIEMWPGWLRSMLFGRVIDIENAFCQFLMHNIRLKYTDNHSLLLMKYPDLVRLDKDKTNYRIELCRNFLGLDPTPENISKVKKLIMALANGSNATAVLMTNGSGRSEAVRIAREMNPDLSPIDLIVLGDKLSSIVRQFKSAKRALCIYMLNEKPTKDNVKKIFKLYFEWERDARYKIWELTGKTGLHLHDGIDGILNDMDENLLIEYIEQQTSIRVSVDTPDACTA